MITLLGRKQPLLPLTAATFLNNRQSRWRSGGVAGSGRRERRRLLLRPSACLHDLDWEGVSAVRLNGEKPQDL